MGHGNYYKMKKIILSTNWNPDYLYYLPLTVWAWRKFGWESEVFYEGAKTDCFHLADSEANCAINHLSVEGYRSDTIAQISRLYAACVTDGYLMTGDIDMMPLSDYWKDYNENEITIWGHDLTGFGHYPICYIGMPHTRWIEVMGLVNENYNALIRKDLDHLPQAKDTDFYKYWFSDQDLITQRIQMTEFPRKIINRGQLPNGYARGRVDRGAWSLDHPEMIDCHMLRDMYKLSDTGLGNYAKTMRLLEKVWPQEDFTWFREYTTEFQKLAKNG